MRSQGDTGKKLLKRQRPPLANSKAYVFLSALTLTIAAVWILVASASIAIATPSWLSPTNLSTAGYSASQPRVALGANGDAAALWGIYNGANWIVQAATRPAGGSWSASANLSGNGQNAYDPKVAVDADGDAVAVWRRFDGANFIVQAATRPAGGVWSSSADNLSDVGQDAYEPNVELGANGDAVAVWRRYDGANWIIQAATRPAGGVWSSAVDLSSAGLNADKPQVAVDAIGDAFAVWRRYDGANWIIQAATRPAGGTWGATGDISTVLQDADNPQVAVDADGDAVAVWSRRNGTNWIVQAVTRPAGGVWSASAGNLSTVGRDAIEPQVKLDADGDTVAMWRRFDGTNFIVQAANRPTGGSWSVATDVSSTGQNVGEFQVTLNANGDAVVVWSLGNGSNFIAQAVTRPAGGSWSASVNLSADGQNVFEPQVALDANGDAVAVWNHSDGVNDIVQAAIYTEVEQQPEQSPTPTQASDTIAPTIDKLKVTRKQLHRSRLKKLRKKAISLSFELSEDAEVKLRLVSRKKQKVCKVSNGKRRCKRTRILAKRTYKASQGANSLKLKVETRYLKLGTYRVDAIAIDAAGNSSATFKALFRVVR